MCTTPLHAFEVVGASTDNGKRLIVFTYDATKDMIPVELPCGQCMECRLKKSRDWAVRCMHEASKSYDNMFLTLTYDDLKSTSNQTFSLNVEDFTLFMKRYRKKFPYEKIRYFHCGEYGENFGRPHHHAIIFGHRMSDLEPVCSDGCGGYYYASDQLNTLWPFGFVSVGDVTFESCAYVSRYITKKLTGDMAESYGDRKPEFITMSRRPGIGADWLQMYGADTLKTGKIVIRDGQATIRPPKAYLRKLENLYPDLLSEYKFLRAEENFELQKRKEQDYERAFKFAVDSAKRHYDHLQDFDMRLLQKVTDAHAKKYFTVTRDNDRRNAFNFEKSKELSRKFEGIVKK